MNLRQIQVLHAILSSGSVTAAAAALHVSQPAVSKTLQHTEQQLGFALFEREGNRLRPTEEALALYSEIEKIFPQLTAVERLAANLRRGTGRTLRIVTLPSLAQNILPAALNTFVPAHPDLDVELRTQHTPELISALILRDAELGLDFGGIEHPAIERRTLASGEFLIVAPRGWFPQQRRLAPAKAARFPRIRMAANDPLTLRLDAVADGAWARIPSPIATQGYHSALALVAQGLGFAIVDPFTAASRDPEKVVTHRLDPPLEINLQWLVARHRVAAAPDRAFVRQLTTVARRALGLRPAPDAP